MKNYNFVCLVSKQCNNDFFYLLARFIGSLIGKTVWDQFDPTGIWCYFFLLAHDKDVQH